MHKSIAGIRLAVRGARFHFVFAVAAFSTLATTVAAAPLKVLVIGGPGVSFNTMPDAVLAEILGRKYGWETRYSTFFTLKDESVTWRALGTPQEVRQQMIQQTLSLLNDWKPDVTLARIPRLDFDANPAELQQALVARVREGMGLVTWATDHGSVDYTGQPLLEILPGLGFGADYSGGFLVPEWKWADHRLNFGLPLDQQAPQMFYSLTGDAAAHQAVDLVSTGDGKTGRIRVREAGKGRVVMLGHDTRVALGPSVYPQLSEPFTMDVMYDRPDGGEVHLRLVKRAVLWAKGEAAGDRVALQLAALPTAISTGTPQQFTVRLLNETGSPVKASVLLAVASRPGVEVGTIEAPPGVSEHSISATLPTDLPGGWLPLEVSLQREGKIIGSPPAVALRYFKAAGPLTLNLVAEQAGAARGKPIVVKATLQRTANLPLQDARLIWTVNDFQQRVLFAEETDLKLESDQPIERQLEWTLPPLDPTHYRYLVRATAMQGDSILADAVTRVFRAERYRLNEGIYHGAWTDLGQYPEGAVPSLLDLYEDAGCRGVHTLMNQFQLFYQEDRNWRGYCETFHAQSLADWGTLNQAESLEKARQDVKVWLRRNPLQRSGAFPILSLGEEAGLMANGAPICDAIEKDVPPDEYKRIRQGYLDYLQRTYGTLDGLNAQWEKAYTAWDQVEMPWKYFNFYYPQQAMPDKGVTNMSLAVDQWGYMADVWQKAYDAHTHALEEVLPTARTLTSTGNFYGTKDSTPNATDRGHTFSLEWAFSDDLSFTQKQFGSFWTTAKTMSAYWYDMPLVFNPDLTHTRATGFRRGEMPRILERAPLILTAESVPPIAEVAVYRPQSPYSPEFYTLLGNAQPKPFLPTSPDNTWRQLLHTSGITPSDSLMDETRLAILPLPVTMDESHAQRLAEFVRAGGTLVTTSGLAEYNLRGKPYSHYPGAGMADLLGISLQKEYFNGERGFWTLEKWPTGESPASGKFFSMGHDKIAERAPDVEVLGSYADGTPALLHRVVGRGHVFHLNAVYYVYYQRTSAETPSWPLMGTLAKALADLAGVSAPINVLDAQGQPLESWDWNIAGAGTNKPGPADVRIVRIQGSLVPLAVQIVSKAPVAWAYDALTERALSVEPSDQGSRIAITLGPESAHYVALFPYRPMAIAAKARTATVAAGSLCDVGISITDENHKSVSGRHAVVVRATMDGKLVHQWGEIAGTGIVRLPTSVRDVGAVTIDVEDLTSGLRGSTQVTITPSPLADHLPPPVPGPIRGVPPRSLSDDEVVATLSRLAKLYASGPKSVHQASEFKWRLGYYTFLMDDSRHNFAARLLAPSPWNPSALHAALRRGARWILTGEDVGRDPLQAQTLSPHDHLKSLGELARQATGTFAVAGEPDQIVLTFENGGRLLIDRRSFDYWSPESRTTQVADWDKTSVVTRSSVGSYAGTPEQFSEAYQSWWTALEKKGLFGDQPAEKALLRVPVKFALAAWLREGFSPQRAEAITLAGKDFQAGPEPWKPPARLDGYRVGQLLFEDEFTKADNRWKLNGGHWRWEKGRLVQEGTSRGLEEGEGWGGRAVIDEIADPRRTPVLVEAVGRVKHGVNYGKLGVTVGYIPSNVTSGLECMLLGDQIAACRPSSVPDKVEPHGLYSQSTDIQFVLLADGNRLRAKVWNIASQSEPTHWQVDATIANSELGSSLMLETEIWASWDHVRIWEVKRE